MICGGVLEEAFEKKITNEDINSSENNTVKIEHNFENIQIPKIEEDDLIFANMSVYYHDGSEYKLIDSGRVNPPLYLCKDEKPAPPEIKVYKVDDESKENDVKDAWINSDAKVVIGSTFSTAGVKQYTYSSSGAKTLDENTKSVKDHSETVELTISEEGVTEVKAKLTDDTDVESLETSEEVRIDRTKPKITITGSEGHTGTYWGGVDLPTIHVEEQGEEGKQSGVDASSFFYFWSDRSYSEIELTEQLFSSNHAQQFTHSEQITTIPENSSGTYYLCVMAKDKAGNVAYAQSEAYTIDEVAPTITFGETNGTNDTWSKSSSIKGITVTVSDSLAGVKNESLKYLWATDDNQKDSSDFESATQFTSGVEIPLPADENKQDIYYLWIYAEDKVGNHSIEKSNAFKIDDVAPTIQVTLNRRNDNYLSKSDTLTITVNDGNGSGVDNSSLKYLWSTVDEGDSLTEDIFNDNAKTYTSGNAVSIELEKSGKYYLYVMAKDNAGNAKFEKEGTTYTFDDTAPTVNFSINGTNNAWQKSESIPSITVTVTDDEGGSEINTSKLKYLWEKGSKSSSKIYANFPEENSFTSEISITTIGKSIEGIYYLWIYAEDNAGNSTIVCTSAFQLDDIAPNITKIEPFDNPTYSKAETINITIEENGSGIDTNNYKYQWTTSDEGDEKGEDTFEMAVSGNTINSPKTNGTYYLYILVKDTVGNKAIKKSGPYKIDVTNPVIEIEPLTNAGNLEIKEPIVTIDADKKNESEVKAYYLWQPTSINTEPVASDFHTPLGVDKVVPPDSNGTYYLYVYAIDEAGNSTIAKSGSFEINRNRPDAPKIVAKATLENNTVEIPDGGTISKNVKFEFTLKEMDIGNVKEIEVTVTKEGSESQNVDVQSKGNGVYEYDLSDQADGTYKITAIAKSNHGEESAPVNFTITIDTSAPVPPDLTITEFDKEASQGGAELDNNDITTKQVKIEQLSESNGIIYKIEIYKRTDVTLTPISLYSEININKPGTEKTNDYRQGDNSYVIDEPGMFDIYLTSTNNNGKSSVVVQHITITDTEAPKITYKTTAFTINEHGSKEDIITATDNLKVEGFRVETKPTLGTFELDEITGRYTYTATSYGDDIFGIVAYDHAGNVSSEFIINVTIIKNLTESDCVSSNSTTFNVRKNETQTVSLNATDKNNKSITYNKEKNPTHGEIEVGTSYVKYTPAKDYIGDDSFTIKASVEDQSIEIVFKVSVVNSTTSHGGGSSSGGGGGSKKTKTYKITVKVGDHGSVDPDGTIEVEEKKSITLTIVPDKNYVIDSILVDGKTIDTVTKYTFENVTDDHNFEVTFKLENSEAIENTLTYVDVSPNDWYFDAVKFVTENNLMNGIGNDAFSPNTTLTRGMLVTVLYRLANVNTTETATFADVDPNMYYSAPIAWASANKIVNGVGDNNFAPEVAITREQMATIFARYIENLGVQITDNVEYTEYADASAMSEYAIDAVAKLTKLGLMQGKSATMFDPQGTATRAETATLLMRFVQKITAE